MRHGNKTAYLGRTASHRKAMLRNMAISLIEHKAIKTTLTKAKALRVFIEPLITKAKTDTMHSRRVLFSYLQNKEAVKELFGEIAEKVGDRPGGYTRILKLGQRRGDNAELALIELVDYNEFDYSQNKNEGGSRRRRRRRGGKGKGTAKAESKAVETKVEESAEVVKDKLTKVEGIGPKVQELLYGAGIETFAQLAATEADRLKEILSEAGGVMKSMDPTTWPQQAGLAAEGKFDELSTLQDELKGGKVVEEAPAEDDSEEDKTE
ncbi:MAG: 50S ribosomal protein L17 [Bacteroidia bacterium]|nr:50S ribosomal protein L17 [Bacteroidia bacterium]